MRKIEILNPNYERLGLDLVAYTDSDGREWTYREIFEPGYINSVNQFDNASDPNYTYDENGYFVFDVSSAVSLRLNINFSAGDRFYRYAQYFNQDGGNTLWVMRDGETEAADQYEPMVYVEETFHSTIQVATDSGDNIQIVRSTGTGKIYHKFLGIVDLSKFETEPSLSYLNAMSSVYVYLKHGVEVPGNQADIPTHYVVTAPEGLGTRNRMLDIDGRVYGHELDFENIQLDVNFGIYSEAYQGFRHLMKFLRRSRCVIAYDWGSGVRYTDARVINAPKTEKHGTGLLTSRLNFKRLNPWYDRVEHIGSAVIENSHEKPISINFEIEVDGDNIRIEAEHQVSGLIDYEINLSGLPETGMIYIDSENKRIYDEHGNNLYQYIDHSKDSFLNFQQDESYNVMVFGDVVSFKIRYRKWVVD